MFHVKHNVIIIGSGPAGYTAAIYLGRAGLNPVMVTGALSPGGQLVNTTEVENFPGFPEGILGPDLMDRMKEQAKRFGTTYIADDVSSIEACESDSVKPTYRVTLSDDSQLEASSLIIATGSSFRKLGVPGEQELSGHGVSYCATCDGFFFRNKPIVVVGGGDSAFEEALFLTRFGSSVTLIHRRDSFRASQIMVDRAKANPTITLMTNTVVTSITGTSSPTQNTGAPIAIPGLTLKRPAVAPASVSSIAAVMRDAVCFFTVLPPAYTETATIAGRMRRSPSRYPFWNTSQTLSLSYSLSSTCLMALWRLGSKVSPNAAISVTPSFSKAFWICAKVSSTPFL